MKYRAPIGGVPSNPKQIVAQQSARSTVKVPKTLVSAVSLLGFEPMPPPIPTTVSKTFVNSLDAEHHPYPRVIASVCRWRVRAHRRIQGHTRLQTDSFNDVLESELPIYPGKNPCLTVLRKAV
jgi:hypothetical protein